jgi:hypothetical protein
VKSKPQEEVAKVISKPLVIPSNVKPLKKSSVDKFSIKKVTPKAIEPVMK